MKRGAIGVSSLSAMQELIHAVERKSGRTILPQAHVDGKPKGKDQKKHYVELAAEVLAAAVAFGLIDVTDQRHTMLWGGIIGGALGVGTLWLHKHEESAEIKQLEPWEKNRKREMDKKELLRNLLSVGLYTASGVLAGAYEAKGNRKLAKKLKKLKKQSKREK